MKKMFLAASMGVAITLTPVPGISCLPQCQTALAAPQTEKMEVVRGCALSPGDTIGVLAPASNTDVDELKNAVRYLEKLGYKVKLAPSCKAQYGYFAGTDSQRAADINHFFADDEVKAILCLRGGYGSSRVLDKLDYEAIRQHPKQFIGYSDVTALHIALGEKSRLSTVHGPMLTSFEDNTSQKAFTREIFAKGVSGSLYPGEIPLPAGKSLQAISAGRAEGPVIGGNLTIVQSLIGTPYELQGEGAILFLEDVGEATYGIDRALQQLWQSGLLSRVNGVIVGDFTGADDDYEEGDFHLDEVLAYYARLSGKPWLKGVPAGHDKDNIYLPFGVRAVMEAHEDGTASLCISEIPVNRQE
ncbi:MAG: LD-carboxypeptidase [Selenomonas sp.]|nr:LD-carboxypeptidase [Selenomonas sp.]